MERRPIVAISGKIKSGKSTLLNALQGGALLPAGHLEVTALPTYMVNSSDRARCFRVFYPGRHCDLPLEALSDFMAAPDPGAVKVALYCPPSPLLEKISFVDLPGSGSTSESAHNEMAKKFLASAKYDVAVQVITSMNELDHNNTGEGFLPHKRLIVLNKIDNKIKWEDDSCSPEEVIDDAVSRCRAHLQRHLEASELMPQIVGCMSIAGLAAVAWDTRLLQRLLLAAKCGDLDRLSQPDGLTSILNAAIIENANAALRGPSSSNYLPGYPALRIALGITMREGIMTPATLRHRLFRVSGIEKVRSAIERSAASPLIKLRRQLLPNLMKSQSNLEQTQTKLYDVRRLIQTATHLGSTVGLSHTEELRFIAAAKPFFQKEAEGLAAKTFSLRKNIQAVRKQYINQGNALA